MNEPSSPGTAPPRAARTRVAVVFGGRSSEHAISCITAGSVLRALAGSAYEVVPIGIAPDGRWVLESDDPARLAIDDTGALPEVDAKRTGVALEPVSAGAGLVATDPSEGQRALGDVDVVLPLLHGPWGEDGTIQGLLEMMGVPYVGAGVLASAVSMDKAMMKVVLAGAGLPLLPSRTIARREWADDPTACRAAVAELGFPVFVKPVRGGSSIGISRVREADALDAAVEESLRHDTRALVEQCAPDGAREVECGVLEAEDGSAETSVPGEIRVGGDHDFYDFEAKYLGEQGTEIDVPAELPDDVTAELRRLAAAAFTAVGGSGLARVDFFVCEDGKLLVNEINTMPGFTPTSMFPQMWAAVGLDYPSLVDRLLTVALRRHEALK